MIKYRKDTDDIVTLTLDMKDSKANIINHQICQAFQPVIVQLRKEKEQNTLTGVIITSAKKTFLAGGDLKYIYQADEAKSIFEYTEMLKGILQVIHPQKIYLSQPQRVYLMVLKNYLFTLVEKEKLQML